MSSILVVALQTSSRLRRLARSLPANFTVVKTALSAQPTQTGPSHVPTFPLSAEARKTSTTWELQLSPTIKQIPAPTANNFSPPPFPLKVPYLSAIIRQFDHMVVLFERLNGSATFSLGVHAISLRITP